MLTDQARVVSYSFTIDTRELISWTEAHLSFVNMMDKGMKISQVIVALKFSTTNKVVANSLFENLTDLSAVTSVLFQNFYWKVRFVWL